MSNVPNINPIEVKTSRKRTRKNVDPVKHVKKARTDIVNINEELKEKPENELHDPLKKLGDDIKEHDEIKEHKENADIAEEKQKILNREPTFIHHLLGTIREHQNDFEHRFMERLEHFGTSLQNLERQFQMPKFEEDTSFSSAIKKSFLF